MGALVGARQRVVVVQEDGVSSIPPALADDLPDLRRRHVEAEGLVSQERPVHDDERALAQVQRPPAAEIEEREFPGCAGAKADLVDIAERRVMVEPGRLVVPPCLWVVEAEVVLTDTPRRLIDARRAAGRPKRVEFRLGPLRRAVAVVARMEADLMPTVVDPSQKAGEWRIREPVSIVEFARGAAGHEVEGALKAMSLARVHQDVERVVRVAIHAAGPGIEDGAQPPCGQAGVVSVQQVAHHGTRSSRRPRFVDIMGRTESEGGRPAGDHGP